jgi:CRISPR/Cas system-associated exonuclease Cas4 (RecB family)
MSYIDDLIASLRKKYDKDDRKGTHVSDLVLCPRKSVHRRLFPQKITMRELNFFTSGSAIHGTLQSLALQNKNRYSKEYNVIFGEVSGHVDLYDKIANAPIEIKSSRTKGLSKPKSHHVKQLKYYMAMLDSKFGSLIYQFLNHFDDEPFKEFEVKIDAEESKKLLEEISVKAENFKEALTRKDYMIAKGIMNDFDLNWNCTGCPLFEECKKELDDIKKCETK